MGKLCFLFEKGIKTTAKVKYWRDEETKDAKKKRAQFLEEQKYDLGDFTKEDIMGGRDWFLEPNMFPCNIKVKSERHKEREFKHFTLWSVKAPQYLHRFIRDKVREHFGEEKIYIVIKNDKFSMPVWHIHLGIVV